MTSSLYGMGKSTQDGEIEHTIQDYIDDELADADPADVRHLAEGYLQLVAAIEMTMADIADWADDELSEVQRLSRYLAHLTEADHGVCDLCGRVIFAPHAITELPRRRFRHLRRLAEAFRELWYSLRFDSYRFAHSDCADRQH